MAQKEGVLAIIGMIFVVLSVSLVLPAMVISLESPQDITFTQTEGIPVVLSGSITSEAIDVTSGGNPSVNITVVNEQTGEIQSTGMIPEGGGATLEFSNGNITITDVFVIDGNEAIIQYEYPTYIGFPANADILFKNIELFIVLITIIMLGGVFMILSEVYN